MSRVAVLSNPASGRNRNGLHEVEAACRALGLAHATTGEAAELEAVLRNFAAEGVDVLAINGGDGTLVATLTAIRNRRAFAREPLIALLRGGSTNMVHDDVGVPGRPARALERVAAACREGVTDAAIRRRAAIAMRHDHANDTAFGFFFAAAAGPRAIRAAQRTLHRRGLAGPLGDGLSLASTMLRLVAGRIGRHPILHPTRLAWSLDGGSWREAATVLLTVTTLERLLFGLRPAPPDGGLGVAGLLWPYHGLWRRLPGFLRGRGPDEGGGLWRARAGCLSLKSPDGYVLDGEPVEPGPGTTVVVEAAAPARFLVV